MSSAAARDLMLAIDCGTQSVRALVVDARGDIVAKAREPLDDYVSLQPGWLEHDAEGFWQATARACRRLLDAEPTLRARLRGLAVTTQRGSIVPVDDAGRALRPFIVWLDQRRASRGARVSALWRAAFAAARVTRVIDYFAREAEVNWLAEHEPETLARAKYLLLLSGWLNLKLTGRAADAVASQVGYLPFDFKRHRWAARSDWRWQVLAARREQMPELLPAGREIGRVTRAASEACGLPEGLAVIAAAADKACEIVGAGATAPGIGAISYGTTATIGVTLARYAEVTPLMPPYPALLPGHYNAEVQIYRGYWMVAWFKEQFGHLEREQGAREGVAPEALFDRLVAAVPPGSEGLLLQPYWTPGIREPGPEARGAIIGFSDVHTRAHVYRAILEGLAYALREGKERIERRTRTPITNVRVSGGGSQSDAAMQITADVFGLPAVRPHVYETSGLGAAIAAAVGTAVHRDFDAAVRAMTRTGRTFEPDRANAARYDALYTRIYRRLYARLEPLYAELQAAVGR
jgi:sugar (pentulose or hexulose) kinase